MSIGKMDGDIYISVDAEMSGHAPGMHSLLSIGATVVGMQKDSFYAELKPLNMNFVPEALAVAGFSLEELAKNGKEPKEAIDAFASWVEKVSDGRRAVFVSFGTSDWLFVKWYLVKFGHENLFGPNSVDMKSYYMGMENTDWR
jgi:ribonuclease T